MHWRKLLEKQDDTLGSWDLEVDGAYVPVVVTIKQFFQGEFKGGGVKEQKVFVRFDEYNKPMVCNTTNFKRLQTKFGSFDPDDYVGKRIILGVEKVKSPEGMVDALRFSIREIPAPKALPMITETEMAATMKSLMEGKTTIEKVKQKRTLTPEQETELNNAMNT
jgi:hypothetical protein